MRTYGQYIEQETGAKLTPDQHRCAEVLHAIGKPRFKYSTTTRLFNSKSTANVSAWMAVAAGDVLSLLDERRQLAAEVKRLTDLLEGREQE
jgi:hypothetical protein